MHIACCLTRLCGHGGGHGVVLGGGVLAVVFSESGGSRLDARVYAIYRLLPLCHLHHAAVRLTHCHARKQEV